MCATLHLHNLKSLPPKSFYATRIRPDFSLALRKWFQRFPLVQPEIFADNIILHFTLNNLILNTFVQLDFKILHLHNLKSLQGYYCTLYSHNLTFTTFVQLDFTVLHLYNIKSLSTISSYTTLAQPEFDYILTTWFQGSTLAQPEIFFFLVKWHISRHTRTPWFSLHPKLSCLFHSCYVCMFSYISVFRTYIYV